MVIARDIHWDGAQGTFYGDKNMLGLNNGTGYISLRLVKTE